MNRAGGGGGDEADGGVDAIGAGEGVPGELINREVEKTGGIAN